MKLICASDVSDASLSPSHPQPLAFFLHAETVTSNPHHPVEST